MTDSTIFALSTVMGKSGVAVIRVSGAKAAQVISKMTDRDDKVLPPRQAVLVKLRHAADGRLLDHSLLIYFPAPRSFTGEEVVELHIHGSRAVIQSVLESLGSLPDFRLAEPGEFSKRAFYNHKMDLTEAEGLADLIDSETAAQQNFALKQMEGGLRQLYDGWREQLLGLLAQMEAYIDFPDEELPPQQSEQIQNTVFKLAASMEEHLNDNRAGERLRDGFRVVIVGAPNAGKSSLLNAVAKRDAVIVSDIAGTTRDAVDIHLDLDGYPVTFTDTAGLREAEDEIERRGVDVARQKISGADLIICLFDACKDSVQVFENIQKTYPDHCILVANKKDALSPEQCQNLQKDGCLLISAKYKEGLDQLLQKISDHIGGCFTDRSGLMITRQRYRQAVVEGLGHLRRFSLQNPVELSCEDLRLAARELGKITGRIEVEDILEKIFSSFCIGK